MSDQLAKSVTDLVAEAKSQIVNLDPDQVEAELRNPDTVLIDIRDSAERNEKGRIPGAIHVDSGMLEFRADPGTSHSIPELRPDRRVILHCAAGGRSALAARRLQEMGYANVAHLDGGIDAWRESGKPVEE